MADPSVSDIRIIQPAPRASDPVALQAHLTLVSLYLGLGQQLSRQHRKVLLALRDLDATSTTIADLSTTASAGYVQAELQAVIDKVNDALERINEISANLATLIQAANSALISPQDAGFNAE